MGESNIVAGSLAEYEAVIERGLQTFVEVGNALMAIRDGRLYLGDHRTFEDYCRERWQLERRRAYHLMDAAAVVNNVNNCTHDIPPPANEAQARPLTKLPAEQQPAVWQAAVEAVPDGKVTAAHVVIAVEDFLAQAEPEPLQVTHEPTADKMAIHFSSKSPEHYTPANILALVLDVLGDIDLDPCGNSRGAPNVPAARHYTSEDDGLAQEWAGRVFMNPPYGNDIKHWVEKLCESYESGQVAEAIALVPARTDTRWFRRMEKYHVCFVTGRLTFVGNDDPAPFPSALFYFGDNPDLFTHVFSTIGDIKLSCKTVENAEGYMELRVWT